MSKPRRVDIHSAKRKLEAKLLRMRRQWARMSAQVAGEISYFQELVDDMDLAPFPAPTRKLSRNEIKVGLDVVEYRQEFWSEFQLLKAGEYIAQGHNSDSIKDQKEEFALSVGIDPSEMYRWYRGALDVPERCATTRNIERELRTEIERMKAAGVQPLLSAD